MPNGAELGDRRTLIARVILAGTTEDRDDALAALLPLQRKDFTELLDAMDGLPVNIRLVDPPLHEFLPDRTELAVKVALANTAGETGAHVDTDRKLLAAIESLHESNPMLGLRGVRLGLVTPGPFALQVRAVGEAACDQIATGKDRRTRLPKPERIWPRRRSTIVSTVSGRATETRPLPIRSSLEPFSSD